MATIICVKNFFCKANTSRTIYLLRRLNSTTSSENVDSRKTVKNEYYDIVVEGGGMVGTAMAKSLG